MEKEYEELTPEEKLFYIFSELKKYIVFAPGYLNNEPSSLKSRFRLGFNESKTKVYYVVVEEFEDEEYLENENFSLSDIFVELSFDKFDKTKIYETYLNLKSDKTTQVLSMHYLNHMIFRYLDSYATNKTNPILIFKDKDISNFKPLFKMDLVPLVQEETDKESPKKLKLTTSVKKKILSQLEGLDKLDELLKEISSSGFINFFKQSMDNFKLVIESLKDYNLSDLIYKLNSLSYVISEGYTIDTLDQTNQVVNLLIDIKRKSNLIRKELESQLDGKYDYLSEVSMNQLLGKKIMPKTIDKVGTIYNNQKLLHLSSICYFDYEIKRERPRISDERLFERHFFNLNDGKIYIEQIKIDQSYLNYSVYGKPIMLPGCLYVNKMYAIPNKLNDRIRIIDYKIDDEKDEDLKRVKECAFNDIDTLLKKAKEQFVQNGYPFKFLCLLNFNQIIKNENNFYVEDSLGNILLLQIVNNHYGFNKYDVKQIVFDEIYPQTIFQNSTLYMCLSFNQEKSKFVAEPITIVTNKDKHPVIGVYE